MAQRLKFPALQRGAGGEALEVGPGHRHWGRVDGLHRLAGQLRRLGRRVLQDLVQLLNALPLRQVVKGGVHAAPLTALSRLPGRLAGLEGRQVQDALQASVLGRRHLGVALVDDELVGSVLPPFEQPPAAPLAGLEVGHDVETGARGHDPVVALLGLQSSAARTRPSSSSSWCCARG